MGGWEDGSQAAFVMHYGLQEAMTTDLFSCFSADGDSGQGDHLCIWNLQPYHKMLLMRVAWITW